MKFCKECKKLHDGNDTMCLHCRKKYIELTDEKVPRLRIMRRVNVKKKGKNLTLC